MYVYKYFASLPTRHNESEITCDIIQFKPHRLLAKQCFHKPIAATVTTHHQWTTVECNTDRPSISVHLSIQVCARVTCSY